MQSLRNTFAQIDLTALKHNLKAVRSCMPMGSKIYFCVKADGYGHGAVNVARAAESVDIADFAVELTEEGVWLRENGIKGEILVLGRANAEQMKYAVKHGLSQCVADEDDILLLQSIARTTDSIAVAQLKIDTGMGRIGVNDKTQIRRVIKALQESPNVRLEGIFTHFACADEEDKEYTHHQASIFIEYTQILSSAGLKPKMHAANSAACIELPEYAMDYGRCGIAAYGYAPGKSSYNKLPNLQPVMSVFAEISQIKDVPANFRIGYNSTFVTPMPARIATVQIGYADGYPRKLSNKGKMIVKGSTGYFFAPIVGRVCMDQTMIDITGISGIKKGDLVIAMGDADNLTMNAEDIANICGTISYEILTGFSKRVPRVYINGQQTDIRDGIIF